MSMIDRLTDGDITKQEAVFQLPWIQCLNTLAWWRTKDDYIEQINKMNRLKNGK